MYTQGEYGAYQKHSRSTRSCCCRNDPASLELTRRNPRLLERAARRAMPTNHSSARNMAANDKSEADCKQNRYHFVR